MRFSALNVRRKYSAISFAALALVFSIASAAAPAEVSGANHQPANETEAVVTSYKGYLAFNQHAEIPTTVVYAPAPKAVSISTATSIGSYDSELLDALQAAVTDELDALIELRSF